MIAELQGDLLGASGPHDFSAKQLLIPSLKVFTKSDPKPAAYIVSLNNDMHDLYVICMICKKGPSCTKSNFSMEAKISHT